MALEKNISEIAKILKREIRSFETILELLYLEEKCLVECDTEALADILQRQEDVFSSIACLEKSRTGLLVKIADESGVDVYDINVSALSEKVDGPLKKNLIETGHVLSQLNDEIQKKKATNTMLINQSIMLVESDIRVIVGAMKKQNHEPGYTQHAESEKTAQSIRIDQRL